VNRTRDHAGVETNRTAYQLGEPATTTPAETEFGRYETCAAAERRVATSRRIASAVTPRLTSAAAINVSGELRTSMSRL